MKIIFTCIIFSTILFAQTNINNYSEKTFINDEYNLIIQGFDALIDLYLESTLEEKMDFICSLDDEELEVFMIYLKENHPEEFDLIP